MSEKIKKVRRPTLRFNETEIKLTLSVMEQLEKPIEIMYYLMEREQEGPFIIMLLSADATDVETLVREQKRDTDLLLSIDEEDNLYALICQETKVDGGYRFAQRILQTLISKNASNIYCAEVEIRSTRYTGREVIFKAIESYISAKKDGKENEIIFRSLQ